MSILKFIIKEKNFVSEEGKTKENSYNSNNSLISEYIIKDLNSKLKKESIIRGPKSKKEFCILEKNIFIINIKKMMISFVFFSLLISVITKETTSKSIKMKLSYITIRIKSKGKRTFFYGGSLSNCNPLFSKPKEVHINNVKLNKVSNFYQFNTTDNEIKLVWNNTVTSCNCLFFDCKYINEIDLSNFDSSEVTTASAMFYQNTALSKLNFKNFNTEKITRMDFMFAFCESLTSLNLSNFNTSKVDNMYAMFNQCNSLKYLDLSKFDTSNVIDMNRMFCGCSSLVSFNVSNFDTSKVTDMTAMFAYSESLTSLNLSNFNTSKVKNMHSMFEGCESLKYLDLSNFDTSNVLDMTSLFFNCKSLEYLNITSFNTSKVENNE